MNAVGIDVSKGKSTAAILRPFGEVVRLPFDVSHDYGSLERLADQIICLDGESRVLMEATGRYHEPVAAALHERGILQQEIQILTAKMSVLTGRGNNTPQKQNHQNTAQRKSTEAFLIY